MAAAAAAGALPPNSDDELEQSGGVVKTERAFQVLPYLFLCNAPASFARHVYDDNGITLAINLQSEDIDNAFETDGDEGKAVEYLELPFDDNHEDNLTPHFDDLFDKLQQVKADDGKALMFCGLGKSLSPAMAAAYMMKAAHAADKYLPLKAVLAHLRKTEPGMQPADYFLRQLIALEKSLFDSASVDVAPAGGGRGGKKRQGKGRGRKGRRGK